MIKGFEHITPKLNKEELNIILPKVIGILSNRVGKAKAIKNHEVSSMMSSLGYSLDAPKIRKFITYIRLKGLIVNLIATSQGYYVSNSSKEIQDYIISLQQREDAIRAIKLSFKVTGANQQKLSL